MVRDWRLRKAIKNNEVVFKSLTNSFLLLGKKSLGTGAAAALETAMSSPNTKHDSSRAAANWDVNIGGSNPYGRQPNELAPKLYANQPGSNSGSRYKIGKRRDEGKNEAVMKSRKRRRYGYKKGGRGDASTAIVAENSWIYNQLNIGRPGKPAVHLFNPILGKYALYASRAFPGYTEVLASIQQRAVGSAKILALEEVQKMNAKIRQRGRIT